MAHDSLIDAHTTNTNFTTPIASRDTNAKPMATGLAMSKLASSMSSIPMKYWIHTVIKIEMVNSVAPEAQLTSYNSPNPTSCRGGFPNLDAQDVHIINKKLGSARFSHVTGEEDTNLAAT